MLRALGWRGNYPTATGPGFLFQQQSEGEMMSINKGDWDIQTGKRVEALAIVMWGFFDNLYAAAVEAGMTDESDLETFINDGFRYRLNSLVSQCDGMTRTVAAANNLLGNGPDYDGVHP
jgi:hypothetical protein